MKNEMIRFLKSIKIENIDDFDLDFEMISRNRFKPQQWDMVIVKNEPWEYPLLREFIDSLENIKYQYLLRFSYVHRPNIEQVVDLFLKWYQSIYRLDFKCNITYDENDHIFINYDSKEDRDFYSPAVKDFKDFLNFINYEFTISEIDKPIKNLKVKEVNKEIIVEETNDVDKKESCIENEPQEIEEEQIQEVQEEDNSEKESDTNVSDENVKQPSELQKEVENQMIEIMKHNYELMKKEREKRRINKRGNYTVIDSIDSININSGSVDFDGAIFSIETKDFKGDVTRFTIGVNDHLGGAIYCNGYTNKSITKNDLANLQVGMHIRIRGVSYNDEFSHALMIKTHYIDPLSDDPIEPDAPEQARVELHLHSNMSQMDATSNMDKYCSYAKALGHKAIAITDHAVVQGYPEAQAAGKKTGLKILYGSELYMVDDKFEFVKNPKDIILKNSTYCVLDLETTGLSSCYNDIIEFGAVKVENGMITSHLDILINPGYPLPTNIVEITNITDDLLKDKPTIKEALPRILEFIKGTILVTHNATFDFSFLQEACKKLGYPLLENAVIDTLPLSRFLFPDSRKHNLGSLCKRFEVNYDDEDAHRADYDAQVLADVWLYMLVNLYKINKNITHQDLAKLPISNEMLKHLKPYHVTVLAKNKAGLKDLYKLISLSHIDYLGDVPKVPRSKLQEYRSNLLVGSACFNGEVFSTARYYNLETLKNVIKFYDYIEIQPLANYSWLTNMHELSQEEIVRYIKNIVKCADEDGVPVVATSDCHYCLKEEKIFRDIYISAKGLGGSVHPLNPYKRAKLPAFDNPDQHYRTTKEMLEKMDFLGKEKAFEIVVTNTNNIADQIEAIVPLPNDHLYTPKIEHCEEDLYKLCFDKAHEIYGDPLPEFIQNRLETELNGIINNGYSVIYYIAHKIVKKTHDDGFLVGSRGSVGSSFTATMAGITEVNPLPPHYICKHCHHLEWTSETMPEYRSGYDLPDKICPICGHKMHADGQNIPFETFLGFNADKVPDIDLNFPPDYQSKAHDYTKVLLGEKNVYRAGTIGTVKDKTAYGFARGYIERKGLNPDTYSRAKLSYLASGCVGVKRTTGQHAGGIVVIPKDNEVYDFTPIQYPADEPNSPWMTTHFDFHSIHDTILKLDLLGHVDPQALKMMCELSHIKVEDIPLNDKEVISLFSSPKALKMDNDYLKNKTGALALPEFGTANTRRMLEEINPQSFADLVMISGLSHGTDVWHGNIEELIKNKVTDLHGTIGCRDDIMTYLISKGIPSDISFKIMEKVRKGKGLSEDNVEIMKKHGVPQYNIDSFNKIKYLFPKGHAVAYVTMAMRVGYFKVHYPLEFYATFFSVRSDQYDIQTMIKGKDAIIKRLEELKLKSHSKEKLTVKEEDQVDTLEVALEMVQRGYHFANIDLYRSEADRFVIDHENKALIPSLTTIDGLGINNAITVIEARKEGKFFSKEDLLRRTKLSTTNVNTLADMGVLDDLQESDQLSLFDF